MIDLYTIVNADNKLIIIENKPLIIGATSHNLKILEDFMSVNKNEFIGCRIARLVEMVDA